jgi:hypothetical protein
VYSRAWYTKGVIPLPDPEPEHGAASRILSHPAHTFSPETVKRLQSSPVSEGHLTVSFRWALTRGAPSSDIAFRSLVVFTESVAVGGWPRLVGSYNVKM